MFTTEPIQDPKQVDFIILTALTVEREAVCAALGFGDNSRVKMETRVYWRGQLPLDEGGSYDIVVAQASDMANIDAALLTSDALHHWQPNSALLVGIAGAASKEEQFGDIVVAKDVYYYEKEKLTAKGPMPEPQMFPADSLLLNNLTAMPRWKGFVGVPRPDGTTYEPRLHIGVIASGEKVIADKAVRDEITSGHRKIQAIEMEGYGFGRAVWQSFERVRHLVIKSISDRADSKKDDKWRLYAADSAASFTKHFLLDRPVPPRESNTSLVGKATPVQSAITISSTFPEQINSQIPRDNLIGLMKDRLGAERRVMLVKGPAQSGKTTLLAQFVNTYKDQCFSFSLGTTIPNSDQRYFLIDLCEQMGRVLQQHTDDLDALDTTELQQVYFGFYRRVAQKAKISKQPIFFVVDGLEWLPKNQHEQEIISLLPTEPYPYVFLIGSCAPNSSFSFNYDAWELPFFSKGETEAYFAGLDLNKERVLQIHQQGNGMPGYLSIIRQQIISGHHDQEDFQQLPNSLKGLFELEWQRIDTSNDDLLTMLAVIAFSKGRLTSADLQEVVPHFENAAEPVARSPFLRQDPKTQTFLFVSEAHKQFVMGRLASRREEAEALLIAYYSKKPLDQEALAVLPAYLAKPSTYSQLKSLITPDYLNRALQSTRDINVLQTTLQLVAKQAYHSNDWISLPQYTLISAMLRNISMRPVALNEVSALLELHDFPKALETAYQAILVEDRLELLSSVCSRMLQEGQSVPENILAELEQMAGSIDATSLKERAVEVAVVLFDLLPQTAMNLLKTGIGNKVGDRSLDVARALLTIRLEAEAEKKTATEPIKSSIDDKTLKDFIRTNSPRAEKLSASEVLTEAEKIDATSGKLFILIAWANANKGQVDAALVIEKSLEIITNDPHYGASMRQLRQLAEALVQAEGPLVPRLMNRLDLLKDTALKKPAEEYVRLEAQLSILAERQEPEVGKDRLVEAYFSIDQIEEGDVQCACFTQILIALPQVDPAGILYLQSEVRSRLITAYSQLLAGSADQFAVVRWLLRSVTKVDVHLAMQFGKQLNTVQRRDAAFQEILLGYLKTSPEEIQISVISSILQCFSVPKNYEYAVVRMFERFAEFDLFSKKPEAKHFLNVLNAFRSQYLLCYASAHAIKALALAGEKDLVRIYSDMMKASLRKLDADWAQTELALRISSIIGETSPSLARQLLEASQHSRSVSPLATQSFVDLYVSCLRLAIRTFAAVLPLEKQANDQQLVDLIRAVPSVHERCVLFSDLALRYGLAGRPERLSDIVTHEVTPLLTSCQDEGERSNLLVKIAAALFFYDESGFVGRFMDFPAALRDIAFYRVFICLVTGLSPDDPTEIEDLTISLDLLRVRKACSMIGEMSNDSLIFSSVQELVSVLVQPHPKDKRQEVCQLIERDALDIAQRLEAIALKSLPDKNNIQHTGFLIAAKSAITRLRASAMYRANPSINWKQLAQEAREIPNVSDRLVVLAWMGEHSHKSDPVLSEVLIREAENLIQFVPNLLDRAGRFYSIADVWRKVNKDEEARTLLEQAMMLLRAASNNQTRDRLTGQILQLAHNIDPNFASNLTPLVDDPVKEHFRRLNMSAANLIRKPHQMEKERHQDAEDFHIVLGQAASSMLSKLNSGTAPTRHPKEAGTWLKELMGGSFDDAYPVVAWAVENTVKSTTRPDVLKETYHGMVNALQSCLLLGQTVLGLRELSNPIINALLPDNLRLFQAGTRDASLSTVESWLRENAANYVIIYDPFFSASDLTLLLEVDQDCQVSIFTTWKAQKEIRMGDHGVEKVYADEWQRLTTRTAPATQVMLLGTNSGVSPLVSRFILTEDKGILLTSSLDEKELEIGSLKVLNAKEASDMEAEFVSPLSSIHLRRHRDEKLDRFIFMLPTV